MPVSIEEKSWGRFSYTVFMTSRSISPYLNLKSFASAGETLAAAWPESLIAGRQQPFERLAGDACESDGLKSVQWTLQGELRTSADGSPALWLNLAARARTTLVCQRCLSPAEVVIEAERAFRFVPDEETAAAEDDASDEDVLVQSDPFDWVQLLEDELIMSAPLVPMHDVCPQAPVLVDQQALPSADADRIHPFADLRARMSKSSAR